LEISHPLTLSDRTFHKKGEEKFWFVREKGLAKKSEKEEGKERLGS